MKKSPAKNSVVKAFEREDYVQALWYTTNILEHQRSLLREMVTRHGGNDSLLRTKLNLSIEALTIDIDQIQTAILAAVHPHEDERLP